MAPLWQFAGSLAAVAGLIWLAWRFGFREAPRLEGEAEARSLAADLPGGYGPVAVVMSPDSSCAVLRDAEGRVATVRPHGAHFVARLEGRPQRARRKDMRLILDFPHRVLVCEPGAATAEDWVRALDPLG